METQSKFLPSIEAFYSARYHELKALFESADIVQGLLGIYIEKFNLNPVDVDIITTYCKQWGLTFCIESIKGKISIHIFKPI